MTAAELTARINTLAREIASGAFPRPAARRRVLEDCRVALARLVGSREANDVVSRAWALAQG